MCIKHKNRLYIFSFDSENCANCQWGRGISRNPPSPLRYINVLTFKLAMIQLMVKAAFLQQFFMIALLDDLTVFHN